MSRSLKENFGLVSPVREDATKSIRRPSYHPRWGNNSHRLPKSGLEWPSDSYYESTCMEKKSILVFRSTTGPWSVWTCGCGCDLMVKIANEQENIFGTSCFYVRDHETSLVGKSRCGEVFDSENINNEYDIDIIDDWDDEVKTIPMFPKFSNPEE